MIYILSIIIIFLVLLLFYFSYTSDPKIIFLKENESTYIPQGQKHRLSNPGTEPLEIIEVQSGTYLGEDDIVRFEDIYRRT